MDLKKRQELRKWYEEKKYDKIIDALTRLYLSELDSELQEMLVCAYINTEQYEDAAALLDTLEEDSYDESQWFYDKGRALLGLKQYMEARACFERAAELRPTNADAFDFIDKCGERLTYPVSEKPFTERVKTFWEEFAAAECMLLSLMEKKTESYGEAMELTSRLLSTAFTEIYFEMGNNGEKCELILTAEGEKQRLFRLEFWRDHAPAELLKRWNFVVGRPACPDPERFSLRMYGVELQGDEVEVWPEILENNRVGLNVYCKKLLPLLYESENTAYSILAVLLDQFIGEMSAMKNVGYLKIMYQPGLPPEKEDMSENFKAPIFIHQLKELILSLYGGDEEAVTGGGGPCNLYSGYRMDPKDGDGLLREDIFIGNSCCIPVVNEYYSGRGSIVEENIKDGVVFGFLYYTNGNVERSEMVPFRAEMEDEITELAAESGRILGGATGNTYSYIDCVCFHFKEFLDIAADVMNKRELDEIGFQVFIRDCDAINLKRAEAE